MTQNNALLSKERIYLSRKFTHQILISLAPNHYQNAEKIINSAFPLRETMLHFAPHDTDHIKTR